MQYYQLQVLAGDEDLLEEHRNVNVLVADRNHSVSAVSRNVVMGPTLSKFVTEIEHSEGYRGMTWLRNYITFLPHPDHLCQSLQQTTPRAPLVLRDSDSDFKGSMNENAVVLQSCKTNFSDFA